MRACTIARRLVCFLGPARYHLAIFDAANKKDWSGTCLHLVSYEHSNRKRYSYPEHWSVNVRSVSRRKWAPRATFHCRSKAGKIKPPRTPTLSKSFLPSNNRPHHSNRGGVRTHVHMTLLEIEKNHESNRKWKSIHPRSTKHNVTFTKHMCPNITFFSFSLYKFIHTGDPPVTPTFCPTY